MSKTVAAYILCLLGVAVASCTQPQRSSCFKNMDGWAEGQTADLRLDLSDTASAQTLFISSSAIEDAMGKDITLYLSFKSPSGNIFRDTVNLNFEKTEESRIIRQGRQIQILWPYLEIGKLSEEGEWTISLDREKNNNTVYSLIRGVGISVSR